MPSPAVVGQPEGAPPGGPGLSEVSGTSSGPLVACHEVSGTRPGTSSGFRLHD
jgi:hypothetical protein